MKLQPVIGLETHVQLKTSSKIFSSPPAGRDNDPPNTNISAIDLGYPGVLPVPNKQAIEWSILLGLALGGKIASHSKFDRKHYFYPDLPKAYQISQFDLPIMEHGSLTLDVPGENKPVTIGIERLHLEEDAAKNIHGEDGKTYVDFNRAGTPLCEIVTHPHFTSSAQAKAYLQEMRLIVRTLGISDADMEKGQLRCDVNISLREVDNDGHPISQSLNPKTEIKNVNSFKAVERSIEYEIKRQTKLWERDEIPQVTTTRGWNDPKQITEEQRTKEDSADYRYFPEPDMPPMELSEMADEIARQIPELPRAKRVRFVSEYGIKPEDAKQMIDNPDMATFVEHSLSELSSWLSSNPDIPQDSVEERRTKMMKLFSGWLLNKLMGLLIDRKIDVKTMKISPENFAEFITLLADGKLTGSNGLTVLGKMLDDGSDPSHAMEELGAKRIDDEDALIQVINTIIDENPDEVERYKNGETKLTQWFIGQIMRVTKGNADPDSAARVLTDRLK